MNPRLSLLFLFWICASAVASDVPQHTSITWPLLVESSLMALLMGIPGILFFAGVSYLNRVAGWGIWFLVFVQPVWVLFKVRDAVSTMSLDDWISLVFGALVPLLLSTLGLIWGAHLKQSRHPSGSRAGSVVP